MENKKRLPVESLQRELKVYGFYTDEMKAIFDFWMEREKHQLKMAYLDGVIEMTKNEFFKSAENYFELEYEDYK